MEEDAQPLETPIIAPVINKRHEKLLDVPLATNYSGEFLAALSSNPELIRNVAVSGTFRVQGY
jgi:U5 small nuclear ribonucleoprotein component